MRVYLSVDMEGATGVVHRDQLTHEGEDYGRARKLLTGDVVAAIGGALEAGAEEFLVNDAHGTMRNILVEELPAEAALLSGPASSLNKPLCQTQGCDEGWDLAFFLGYHSRAGAKPGLLAHTWVGALIHEVRVNGEIAGETAANATVLGHHGVPVGLVTGADDLVAEARADLGEVEAVAVKRALGPTAAVCLPPSRTKDMIREGARRAVERRSDFEPRRLEGDVEIAVVTFTRVQAERAARAEGVELVDERTFAGRGASAPEAMAAVWRGVEAALSESSPWLR